MTGVCRRSRRGVLRQRQPGHRHGGRSSRPAAARAAGAACCSCDAATGCHRHGVPAGTAGGHGRPEPQLGLAPLQLPLLDAGFVALAAGPAGFFAGAGPGGAWVGHVGRVGDQQPAVQLRFVRNDVAIVIHGAAQLGGHGEVVGRRRRRWCRRRDTQPDDVEAGFAAGTKAGDVQGGGAAPRAGWQRPCTRGGVQVVQSAVCAAAGQVQGGVAGGLHGLRHHDVHKRAVGAASDADGPGVGVVGRRRCRTR